MNLTQTVSIFFIPRSYELIKYSGVYVLGLGHPDVLVGWI